MARKETDLATEMYILVRSMSQESRIDVQRLPKDWPEAIACLQRSGLFDVIQVVQGRDTLYRVEGDAICSWAPRQPVVGA